jgi:hypothetical protein
VWYTVASRVYDGEASRSFLEMFKALGVHIVVAVCIGLMLGASHSMFGLQRDWRSRPKI